jgi:hypothetical protein
MNHPPENGRLARIEAQAHRWERVALTVLGMLWLIVTSVAAYQHNKLEALHFRLQDKVENVLNAAFAERAMLQAQMHEQSLRIDALRQDIDALRRARGGREE